jgi:hypothetical protein
VPIVRAARDADGAIPVSVYKATYRYAACVGDLASNDQVRTHPASDDHGLTLFCAAMEEKPVSCQRISLALSTAFTEAAPDRIVLIFSTNTVSS